MLSYEQVKRNEKQNEETLELDTTAAVNIKK